MYSVCIHVYCKEEVRLGQASWNMIRHWGKEVKFLSKLRIVTLVYLVESLLIHSKPMETDFSRFQVTVGNEQRTFLDQVWLLKHTIVHVIYAYMYELQSVPSIIPSSSVFLLFL